MFFKNLEKFKKNSKVQILKVKWKNFKFQRKKIQTNLIKKYAKSSNLFKNHEKSTKYSKIYIFHFLRFKYSYVESMKIYSFSNIIF